MEIQEIDIPCNIFTKMFNLQYTEQHKCESLDTFIEYFKNILFAYNTNLSESKLSSDNIAKIDDDYQLIHSAASSISTSSTLPSPPSHPGLSPPINNLSDDLTNIIIDKLENINLLISKLIIHNSSNLVLNNANDENREENIDQI